MSRSATRSISRGDGLGPAPQSLPVPFAPPPLSLLSARRPSLTPSLDAVSRKSDVSQNSSGLSNLRREFQDPPSPDDDDNFRESLQIDMGGLVGDSVGNMSISPTCRDIVLATRKGLFIIDLEAPLEVPRFLAQGGTWDVADVQWNPHHSRSEYIVSTSNERLLIWNLLLLGKTAIDHILHSHYRAIADVNWHTFEPDLVCSTGIDSWIWAWDLRRPNRPAFGLCAFNAGGTQVKWHRKNEHVVASSHMNEVLIWDRRKGSVPLIRFDAHQSKIYGIDWSFSRDELVTCSLDKTIKVWQLADVQNAHTQVEPRLIYNTVSPVWRARDLPFGSGILSVAQRSDPSLQLWRHDDVKFATETFDGHSDVVKEFVWRKRPIGNTDELEYQLITWSKDKTLRFWPIGQDLMQKAGYFHPPQDCSEKTPRVRDKNDTFSFRSPLPGAGLLPAISMPTGTRTVLNEIRAPIEHINPILLPHQGSAARGKNHEQTSKTRDRLMKDGISPSNISTSVPSNANAVGKRIGTMTRGHTGAKAKTPKVEPYAWLASIRGESAAPSSRVSSDSRPNSGPEIDASETESVSGRRSDSRIRGEDREAEGKLQEEITGVARVLKHPRLKLEKYDLTKRRTCTFGLHGPWGDSANVHVFVRVTFNFPKDYPHAVHPGGTPTVDIERSPLVSVKKRAYMQKRLREIRETKRPCLAACLRFLLNPNTNDLGKPVALDSGTSSDEEPSSNNRKKGQAVTLLRDHKNLAEPRTSQGVFGPNGTLVCFFRSLPRIVRAHELPPPPTLSQRGTETVPRLFQSPVLLTDAVRRLLLSTNDQTPASLQTRSTDDNILRIMSNLSSSTRPSARRQEQSRNEDPNFSLLSKRHTTIYLKDRSFVVGAHRAVAGEYHHYVHNLPEWCEANAYVARRHERYDHERVFKTLRTLFKTPDGHGPGPRNQGESSKERAKQAPRDVCWKPDTFTRKFVKEMYHEILAGRDVQLLALFAAAVIKAYVPPLKTKQELSRQNSTQPNSPSRPNPIDYFSLRRRKDSQGTTVSAPAIQRVPSSPPPQGPTLSSSTSSRGSWSSLFNTGAVRYLISGGHDKGTSESSPTTPVDLSNATSIPVPGGGRHRNQESNRKASSKPSPLALSVKSWTDGSSNAPKAPPSSNPRGRGGMQGTQIPVSNEKSLVIVPGPHVAEQNLQNSPMFDRVTVLQLTGHIAAYIEMLNSWSMMKQSAELAKSLRRDICPNRNIHNELEDQRLQLVHICYGCSVVGSCECINRQKVATCVVCRLPVRGLSHSCLDCYHVMHIQCWKMHRFRTCPSGCGCPCL